jgi:spermidine synthase
MNPRKKIATARTPDGEEMVLFQRGRDFMIEINGQDLMQSREHESERLLAQLGCAHLADRKRPCVLIGGLGMGYTLRQALDVLSPDAHVVVGELLDSVIEWNQAYLGELNGQPLGDGRVELKTGDVAKLISRSRERFDAILLDIDNGPDAMTALSNRHLYGSEGIRACGRALRKSGCLAVWSAEPSKTFEQRLMRCGFHVCCFRVPANKGGKSLSRFVWVASEDKNILPIGFGVPCVPLESGPKPHHGRTR